VAQLDRVEQLFSGTTHNHDLRISRLEDWKDLVSDPRRTGPGGIA